VRVLQERTLEGRLFQIAGAAERKPRAPNEMLQRLTERRLAEADCRVRQTSNVDPEPPGSNSPNFLPALSQMTSEYSSTPLHTELHWLDVHEQVMSTLMSSCAATCIVSDV